MPLSNSERRRFQKLGLPEPISHAHGSQDDIDAKIAEARNNQIHGEWKQIGTDIECTAATCVFKHGVYRQPIEENGKHYILSGTDDNGHPTFKEIHPKPNNWRPPKQKVASSKK